MKKKKKIATNGLNLPRNQLILSGWKDIANALGIRSIKTTKKWVKEYSIPVVYFNRKPTILIRMFQAWYVKMLEIESRKKDRDGFVYFMKATETNLVKVGFSKDPEQRLKTINQASPTKIELLGSFPATMADEEKIHKKLKKYRSHGEWFFENPKLFEIIQENIDL